MIWIVAAVLVSIWIAGAVLLLRAYLEYRADPRGRDR